MFTSSSNLVLFSFCFACPPAEVKLGTASIATVMILDDDHSGVFAFPEAEVELSESIGIYLLRVSTTFPVFFHCFRFCFVLPISALFCLRSCSSSNIYDYMTLFVDDFISRTITRFWYATEKSIIMCITVNLIVSNFFIRFSSSHFTLTIRWLAFPVHVAEWSFRTRWSKPEPNWVANSKCKKANWCLKTMKLGT